MEKELDDIIKLKEKELHYLENELAEATTLQFDLDYEYANLLRPIIWSKERELTRLKKLQQLPEINSPDFKWYAEKIFSGAITSFQIRILIKSEYDNDNYDGILLTINRKSKNILECVTYLNETLKYCLSYEVEAEMKTIGWKAGNKEKPFKIKFSVKKESSFSHFQTTIARTLLEPLEGLFKQTTEVHYFFK